MSEDINTKNESAEAAEQSDVQLPPPAEQPQFVEYRAGGLRFITGLSPSEMLDTALNMVKHSMGADAFNQSLAKSHENKVPEEQAKEVAQKAGETAAANASDPFMMEPAAQAVFMFMAREIAYRDRVLIDIVAQLSAISGQTVDLTHPFPPPAEPLEPTGMPVPEGVLQEVQQDLSETPSGDAP